jgi:hypothetical protein
MLPNKIYDVLKFVAQVALPALAVFYAALSQIWGLPYAEEVPATIAAIVLLLGALLQVSTIVYNSSRD